MTDTNPRDLIQRLSNALHDAADDVEGWGNYASSYFQEKHDLASNVARIHAVADEARAYLAQPKPPSLKEQALDALTLLCKGPDATAFVTCRDTIRRALEQLSDSELSPAAQAVLNAVTLKRYDVPYYACPKSIDQIKSDVAAALRAAADQVVPEETWLGTKEPCYAYYCQRSITRRQLLAIATELEAQ
jgi:hypothetical protein